MDTIRSSKKDLDGAVALDHYLRKGQLDLDVTGVKRFFARNMKAIITRVSSRTEREDHCEELKDFMSTLLESPPGNAISQAFEANRAKYPESKLGHLVEITISDCMIMLANQTDFNALRHIRQESGESIMAFNTRFYKRMTEVYPEYERENAFRKNVEKIATLANNLDNHYNLEAFRKEVEDAIHNLNGVDAAKVFTITLMAFLGIYLKKKGWKVVMSNIISRIKTTPNRGTILLPETTTHTQWERDTGRSENTNNTRSGSTRVTMNRTYGREIPTGRDGSTLTLNDDDKEIDKLLEKRGYSFILSIISGNKNLEIPMIVLNIENILMKTYVDDGSEISLMSKKRWSQIGKPKVESSISNQITERKPIQIKKISNGVSRI